MPPYNEVMVDGDASDNQASTNGCTPWSAKLIARAALTLPRLSPLKYIGGIKRKRLIRQHGAQPFRAVADDGTPIDALFFKRTRDCGKRFPVVANHGYAETKEMHFGEVSLLCEHGHDVVLYDLRGHGRSGGRLTTLGVKEVGDLRAVIDECEKQSITEGKVITLGYSTGAAVVLHQAVTDGRVAAVVALTPFASMAGAIRSFHKLYGPWYDQDHLLNGFEHVLEKDGAAMSDSDTVAALRKLNVPAFLAVGDNDVHLPRDQHMDRMIAAACEESVELYIVPDRNHISIYRRMTDGLKDAIVEFCDRMSGDSTR